MADTTEQARDFARSLISHPVAFGTIEHTEKAGEMLTALLAERDALKQTLHDELDANLRLRDLGGAKPDEPMTPFIERVIAERDALAAKLAQARGALAVCERAADMLTAYAELIRRDGASRIDQHHYLPEVEHVAQTLREASPPPALFVPDDAALAQEPAHTDHPARHFDRTCPACAQADILARYSLDDGRREWVNVGTWLYPGEVIAHMDGAALAQEPAAPAPMEPQDARAWWRPSVLPECGPCVTMCRDEADSWLMQGLAAHPLYDAAAIASARRETLKRAAWLAIERPGHFSSFAKAEEFAAALRAMNDGEG